MTSTQLITLADWRENLAILLAKSRTRGEVDLGGWHNPLPSEHECATSWLYNFLTWIGNEHFVTFNEDGFFVEHSIECRLSGEMPSCLYHKAVAGLASQGFDPSLVGRWRIDSIQEEGTPNLSPADLK